MKYGWWYTIEWINEWTLMNEWWRTRSFFSTHSRDLDLTGEGQIVCSYNMTWPSCSTCVLFLLLGFGICFISLCRLHHLNEGYKVNSQNMVPWRAGLTRTWRMYRACWNAVWSRERTTSEDVFIFTDLNFSFSFSNLTFIKVKFVSFAILIRIIFK